jgi:predicted Zn-dependent protease with MMP-like domain
MSKGRHDRRGRAARADNDRRRRPSDGFRAAHGARIWDWVEDAIAELPGPLAEAVAALEVVVEDVPEIDETAMDRLEVPLARIQQRGGMRSLVVYRRPLELRGTTRAEVIEVTRTAIAEEVARYLGIDLDDLYDGEDD